MSTCYWMIEGIGICTDEIVEHIDKKKLAYVLLEQLPDDENLLDLVKNKAFDKLDVDDYLYGEPFDNLADLLCHCDDTDSITYCDDGHGTNYFYYSPSMPWHQTDNEPQSPEEVHKRIITAVQKITKLSSKEIENLIDDELHEQCCG